MRSCCAATAALSSSSRCCACCDGVAEAGDDLLHLGRELLAQRLHLGGVRWYTGWFGPSTALAVCKAGSRRAPRSAFSALTIAGLAITSGIASAAAAAASSSGACLWRDCAS